MKKKVNGRLYVSAPATNACHGCDAFPTLNHALFKGGSLGRCDCTNLGEVCVDRNIIWRRIHAS